MEVKQNDRGLYLFFPTDPEHRQQSMNELEKLRALTFGEWTWSLHGPIASAHHAVCEMVKMSEKVKKSG